MLRSPSFWLAAALTVATWSAALALLVAPAPVQVVSNSPSYAAPPQDERERFAFDLLARLGNTQPSADTVAFVVEWTLAEDSGSGALARNNPLNTTMCGFNQVGAINGDGACGVASYATYEDGLAATVATLAQGNFSAIAYALYANDAVGAFNALIASQWAASHYGGGADWPKVDPRAQGGDIRAELVNYALSLQGMPYVRGGRSVDGGDCSGTMQFIYKQVAGIDIGDSTFSQWPRLQPVEPSQLQAGDLWYGVFPDDEHTGMLADVDGDGRWDLIHNGADAGYLHVTYDFGSTYLGEHTKGYRRAL